MRFRMTSFPARRLNASLPLLLTSHACDTVCHCESFESEDEARAFFASASSPALGEGDHTAFAGRDSGCVAQATGTATLPVVASAWRPTRAAVDGPRSGPHTADVSVLAGLDRDRCQAGRIAEGVVAEDIEAALAERGAE